MILNICKYITSDQSLKKKFFMSFREKIGGGLFSNLLYVLNHLVISSKLGLIPVVDMQNFEGFL